MARNPRHAAIAALRASGPKNAAHIPSDWSLKTSVVRLDAMAFAPSKKQRKVCQRWTRFVLHGVGDDPGGDVDMDEKEKTGPQAHSNKNKLPPFSLIDSIHIPETSFIPNNITPKHKFEVALEPSSYSDEKFALYQKYQQNIHKETKEYSPSGFENFLVETPLRESPINYGLGEEPPDYLPKNYGSYHQLYRLDGELIAMAVLDILPSCVSSVYFMYDDKYEKFSLGKLSALREAALAREMNQYGAPGMKYLVMGFYIHTCPKMRYKGDYSPSYLLDPETYDWHPLEECKKLLEHNRYACFSHPERSIGKEESIPPKDTLGAIPEEDADEILIQISGSRTIALSDTNIMSVPKLRQLFAEGIELLGVELAKRVVFW